MALVHSNSAKGRVYSPGSTAPTLLPPIELDDDEGFGLFDPACRRIQPPGG
jgi:hypothetical protein